MARGDHIRVRRGLYFHHGVDMGDGRVVHYAGLADGLRAGPVDVVDMDRFAAGRTVKVIRHKGRLSPRETLSRALSRVGEERYHVVWRNCEHFATWAVTGKANCRQVKVVSGMMALVAAAFVGVKLRARARSGVAPATEPPGDPSAEAT